MNLLRILQVVVVIATIGCSCCSAQLACSGSQLDDIVRRVSKTRFEARDTKPKLARCHKFVGLIREQKELESAGLALGEPRGQLGDIAKILEQRAGCPGRPLGGLGSLQEFIEDCQELIELAGGAKEPAAAPSESESSRAVADETKRLRDSLAEQSEAARRLADENAKLVRERDEQRQLQASEAIELEAENAKLLQILAELQQLQESSKSQDKSEIRQLQGRNDELVAESKKLRELLADQKRTIETLTGRETDLARKLADAQRSSGLEKATIQELNGKISQQPRMLNELQAQKVGQEAKIKSLEEINARLSGELSEMKAKTAVQAAPGNIREIEVQRDASGKWGLHWEEDIYGGVFVSKVVAGSPAARAGLRFGDQLVQVDGRPTADRDVSKMLKQNSVKLLVRKSPLEQTFVMKLQPGEGPGFVWSRDELVVQELMKDKAAARAGILEDFKLIAVNGESVLGLDGAILTRLSWWPKNEFTLSFMPHEFFEKLTDDMNVDKIRIENNKILADEKAGRY